MGIIRLLPEHEVHKIAAGEVVERPASVVKELLENALDAGATSISIAIKDGGKTLIRIVDNGCGMVPEDAHNCLKNHATSKIISVDDLQTVTTFGFRGEALASIASVSRLTLKTREISHDTGIQLVVEGGVVTSESTIACPVGTDITVQDLFFNVPARQKFLKKDETEWRAIQQLVITSALQHQACSFSLSSNDHQTLHAPAVATPLERMAQVLGTDLTRDLISCTTIYNGFGLSIDGIIARPTRHRYDKNQIFVFVNRRSVKNHKLVQALIKGYNNILPVGQNPIAALFISIDPAEVDINIHPRKEEVRFAHPVTVERCISQMVEESLSTQISRHLSNQTSQQPPVFAPARPWHQHESILPSFTRPESANRTTGEPVCAVDSTEKSDFFIQNREPINPQTTIRQDRQEEIPTDQNRYELMGQLLNTYLIVQVDDSLLLIDQHAAHERVLYELFGDRFNEQASTQLIFPLIVNLNHDESTVLVDYLQAFHAYGIDIEAFGSHAFTIRSVPVYLKNAPFESIIKTFLSWIDEERPVSADDFARLLNEKLRALMACKAAIKAGDRLTTPEMHELITKLMGCEHKTTCPHGRPTIYSLTKHDIEKIFQRCA